MSATPSNDDRAVYLARVVPGRIWQAASGLGGRTDEAQLARAADLLSDLLTAAARHGVRLEDFDCFTDLPQTCVTAIKATDRQHRPSQFARPGLPEPLTAVDAPRGRPGHWVVLPRWQ